TARFRLRRQAFELEVDLRLPVRGVSILFGPSGAGKTTLLRCIAGLERAPSGHLAVGGACWQDSDRGVWLAPHRRSIGYVFQDAALFPHRTVRGNLEYARRRAAGDPISIDTAIDQLELGPLLDRLPDHLSGGERQRVAIGRALLSAPDILLMDEPLAGLDRDAKNNILPLLERLHASLSIPMLYVTHSIAEAARLGDHLVLLRAGRATASGPANELFTRLDLPLARERDAAAVVDAVVAGHDDEYQLSYLDFAGGRLTVSRQDLPHGRKVRVRVAARDVSISLRNDVSTSILNVIPARIVAADDLDASRTLLRLDAGGAILLARITRKSCATLALHTGMRVFAQVKSVALVDQ
ncbi:MAG TPA: molybdenum ABC transporter ATP-binding protein, partial [Gammaproteobacteria bacterium]|nr:molybdenum ABC transporter ATP-binding protein [Gammaproteobacteria bacterium]